MEVTMLSKHLITINNVCCLFVFSLYLPSSPAHGESTWSDPYPRKKRSFFCWNIRRIEGFLKNCGCAFSEETLTQLYPAGIQTHFEAASVYGIHCERCPRKSGAENSSSPNFRLCSSDWGKAGPVELLPNAFPAKRASDFFNRIKQERSAYPTPQARAYTLQLMDWRLCALRALDVIDVKCNPNLPPSSGEETQHRWMGETFEWQTAAYQQHFADVLISSWHAKILILTLISAPRFFSMSAAGPHCEGLHPSVSIDQLKPCKLFAKV